MIAFENDFPEFFSDFAEPVTIEGIEVRAVLEPANSALKGGEAIAWADLIAFFVASDLSTISGKIQTGNNITLNNRRYTIRETRLNCGILEIILNKKEGF